MSCHVGMPGAAGGNGKAVTAAIRICILAALLAIVPAGTVGALEDMECFICHSDPDASRQTPEGEVLSLYIDEELFTSTAHGESGCVSCHYDIEELPHPPDLEPANCSICHVEEEEYFLGVHGTGKNNGDTDVATCVDCHGKHDIRTGSDPLSLMYPLNMPDTCGKCHSDATLVKRHMISLSKPTDAYLHSGHAQAIMEGNMDAAVCNDCHGSHKILSSNNPESPIYRANIDATCGACHEEIQKTYAASIHGRALVAGIPDAPTCTDCHGEHDILPQGEKLSPMNLRQVSQRTCPQCHDNETIMERYGVPTHRQASYMDSFHGMATSAGGEVQASCVNCHGVHNIQPEDDPLSSIHPNNRAETCGKCHQTAGENYATGPVHLVPTAPEQKIQGIVRLAYIWLMIVLFGFMGGHNLLLYLRWVAGKLHGHIKEHGVFRRFSYGQIFGHLVLGLSFTVLVLSGFALRYPDSPFTRIFFFNESAYELRSPVHRWTGVVFIGVTLVNVIWALFWRSGRRETWALRPVLKDFSDLGHNMAYAVGLAKHPPRYDRFSYSEKLEYWGMMWGAVIMIVTGLCMWYAETFLHYFPKVFLDVAALIHFYEAILALGTIIIWHFYHVMFSPEAYPMHWTWITGTVTEEDMKHHHPLEYERMMAQQRKAAAESAPKEGAED